MTRSAPSTTKTLLAKSIMGMLIREPVGFHQGARLQGAPPFTGHRKLMFYQRQAKLRKELAALTGPSSDG